MAVKIRLMRIGAKGRPFYRVVAVDERSKRTGAYIELLGTYNPLTEPKEIILKQDRIKWWMEHGAVLSDGYLRITKQAPQKLPRKPKKEKKSSVVSPQTSERKIEEEIEPVATEENVKSPAEEVTTENPEAASITETIPESETKPEDTKNEDSTN